MNPSLTLKKTSSSPFVKSSQVSNSVKDIQGMFSSFKPVRDQTFELNFEKLD